MFGRKPAATLEMPAPAPVEDADKAFREAWGLTREGWALLTDDLRRDYRDRVVYAPYFKLGK